MHLMELFSDSNDSGKKRKSKTQSIPSYKNTSPISTVKKRMILQPANPENNIEKNTKNMKHDKFCWNCHNECEVDIKCCSKCPRVFHIACLTKATLLDNEGLCISCRTKLNDQFPSVELSNLMSSVVEIAGQMKSRKKSLMKPIFDWPESPENSKLYCLKDLNYVIDKCTIKDFQYKSTSELIEDMQWIYHNCHILFGKDSDVTKTAENILDQLNDALDCTECYSKKQMNGYVFYSHICEVPHPIVWAKHERCPYWPAKCLRVCSGKAHVRFFQSYEKAEVPLAKCYFLSKEYLLNITEKTPVEKIKALEELAHYLSHFEKSIGSFPYEPKNTLFDSQKGESAIRKLLNKGSKNLCNSAQESSSSIVHRQELSEEYEMIDLTDQTCDNLMTSVNESNTSNECDVLNQSSTGIIIEDITSGMDITSDSSYPLNLDQNGSDAFNDPSVLMADLQNEDDIEIIYEYSAQDKEKRTDLLNLQAILQVIMKYDPKLAYSLKDADPKLQQFVIQLWASTNKIINKESLLMQQEKEIKNQKEEIEKLKKMVSHMKENYETYQQNSELVEEYRSRISQQENEIQNKNAEIDKLNQERSNRAVQYEQCFRNADNMVENLKIELEKEKEKNYSLIQVHEQCEKKLSEIKKTEEKFEELQKDFKLIEEKYMKALGYLKYYQSFMEDNEADEYIEMMKDCCSRPSCFNNAQRACCFDGKRLVKYCCKDCSDRDIDHHEFCQRGSMQQHGGAITKTIVVERVHEIKVQKFIGKINAIKKSFSQNLVASFIQQATSSS